MASIEDIGHGALLIGLTGTACAAFGLIGDFFNMADYDKAWPSSLEPETYADETQHNLIRIEQRLGEACVQTITVYLPGHQLADRSEDSVVSDLLRNPDQVCGDNPTRLRSDYSEYAAAVGIATNAANDIPRKIENAEEFKDYLAQEHADAHFHGWQAGGAAGLGVGTAVGLGLLIGDVVGNRATKRRAQEFWGEEEK